MVRFVGDESDESGDEDNRAFLGLDLNQDQVDQIIALREDQTDRFDRIIRVNVVLSLEGANTFEDTEDIDIAAPQVEMRAERGANERTNKAEEKRAMTTEEFFQSQVQSIIQEFPQTIELSQGVINDITGSVGDWSDYLIKKAIHPLPYILWYIVLEKGVNDSLAVNSENFAAVSNMFLQTIRPPIIMRYARKWIAVLRPQ